MSICKLLSIDKVRDIAKVICRGSCLNTNSLMSFQLTVAEKGMPCTFIYSKRSSMQKIRKLSLLVPPRIVARPRTKKRDTDRATFVWPWNENARTNRNNKRTEIERFDWFIEWIQTRVAFGWLIERSADKTSCPKNFLEINRYFALTSYCNTIGQSNNAFSILGFSLAGKRRVHVLIFSSIKTNNEHLSKPFFKVIRKSLYVTQYKLETIKLNRLK